MKSIRVVIVEDEPLARAVLQRLVAAEPELSLVAECTDGIAALDTIRAERPDLLFLDIRLPGLSGLEVLQQLDGDTPPAVIFVTASDQHAVRAFSSHAVDYLLKPFTRERFRAALARARTRLRARTATSACVSVKIAHGYAVLRLKEIESITAGRTGSAVHTVTGTHRTRQTLGELQKKLPPEKFLRVNRSTLLQAALVAEVIRKPHGDGRVRMKSGREFALARRWRAHWGPLLGPD